MQVDGGAVLAAPGSCIVTGPLPEMRASRTLKARDVSTVRYRPMKTVSDAGVRRIALPGRYRRQHVPFAQDGERMVCWQNGATRRSTFVHEITVALTLLDGVQATASDQGIDRVSAVHVRVGALSGVVRDALLFSWDVATADTIAEGSRLLIEEIPLVVFCERCEGERAPRPGTGLLCPECETPSPRILRGREMQLVAMEVPV
jgi:hydrogenase nickel incorporation protein HypA/HybF